MSKDVILINPTTRTFNGVKPSGKIAVDESRVEFFLNNGFEKINTVLENKKAEEKAELDALNSDLEASAKATKKAEKQAKTQAELDAEYEAKKTEEETPAIGEDEEDIEGEDLDGEETEAGEETKEDAPAEAPAISDLDALNSDLEAVAPAKAKRK